MMTPLRCMIVTLAALAPAAPVESGDNSRFVPDPVTGGAALNVVFDDSIPIAYRRYVEDAAHRWVLYVDGSAYANPPESPWFTLEALVDSDDAGNDVLGGYAVLLARPNVFATYEIAPGAELREELAALTPKPDALMVTRVLWEPEERLRVRPTPKAGFARLRAGEFMTLDVQPITDTDNSSAVAIDYTIELPYRFSDGYVTDATTWRGLSAVFESRGYLRVPEDDDTMTDRGNDRTSVVSTLGLKGTWTSWKPEAGAYGFLTEDGAGVREDRVLDARRRGLFDPLDVTFDLHLRHEATQDFEDYQFAGGIGVAAQIPFPRFDGIPLPLLPLAPLLGVNREDLATIQQPWFAASLDFVFDADESNRRLTTPDSEFARLRFEVAWTSEVVAPNTWLYFNLSGWWELDAPAAVRAADRDFDHLLDLGLKIPINNDGDSKWFIIKFQDGALPPNYQSETQVKAGFSLAF